MHQCFKQVSDICRQGTMRSPLHLKSSQRFCGRSLIIRCAKGFPSRNHHTAEESVDFRMSVTHHRIGDSSCTSCSDLFHPMQHKCHTRNTTNVVFLVSFGVLSAPMYSFSGMRPEPHAAACNLASTKLAWVSDPCLKSSNIVAMPRPPICSQPRQPQSHPPVSSAGLPALVDLQQT